MFRIRDHQRSRLIAELPIFALLTVLIVGFLLAVGIMPARTQGNPVVTVETSAAGKSGDPQTGNAVAAPGSNITTVTLTLTGGQCPAIKRTIPVDVVLVIDVSLSMQDPTGDTPPISKLEATKQAAQEFVTRFNLNAQQPRTSDQVAVIAFSQSAQVVLPLSRDRTAIKNAIQGLQPGSGTNIAAALRAATDLLAGSGGNFAGDASAAIVLLSDGGKDESLGSGVAEIQAAADRARQLVNARVITIGLGQPGNPNQTNTSGVDRELLAQIANGGSPNNPDNPNDDAFFSQTAADLRQIYDNIASSIQPVQVAAELSLTYLVDTGHFRLVKDAVQPPPFSMTDQQITWNVGTLLRGNHKQLRFDLEAIGPGQFNAGSGQVQYLPCAETKQPQNLPFQGPSIQVLVPTNTPTPTATYTPTNTPTFTPTATATLNSILRTAVPGSLLPARGPAVTSDYCTAGWWDLLPWILAAIAALISVLILLWWSRRQKNPGIWKTWCFWVRALLLAWITFLVWLFAGPLRSNVCDLRETIYFWRSDASSTGIYMTYSDLPVDQEPAQVAALNGQGCVGCHTVSRENNLIGAVNGPIPGRFVMINSSNQPISVPSISAVYVAFSPNGKRLAITDNHSDLYLLDISDDLTTVGQPVKVAGASDSTYGALMPTWNPDSQHVTFVRAERSHLNGDYGISISGTSDLFTVDINSGKLEQVLPTANERQLDYYPAYSPDGHWLAFTRSPDTTYSSPNADIWLMNVSTRQALPLSANSAKSDSWPTWSLDGKRLAYNTTQFDDNFDVVVVNIDSAGNASAPLPVRGASQPGVFEHLPYWGHAIRPPAWYDQWRAMLPWLLPLLPLLFLLAICLWPRRQKPSTGPIDLPAPPPPDEALGPQDLPEWNGVRVLWEPQPALVLGLGSSGWHILTHLKKTLHDAALGKPSPHVRLLSVVDASQKRIPEAGTAELQPGEEIVWRDSLSATVRGAENDLALRDWIDPQYFINRGDAALDPQVGLQGRRSLGRVALIQNLRGKADQTGKLFWNELEQAARGAVHENVLTVIIVSDLSDDIGSGSFLDVAYLVHRLKDKLQIQNVRVIGHLITERALQGAGKSANGEINTAAALRELTRFQLASAVPFTMTYRRNDKEKTEFDGVWNQRLFDEIYLYDGERSPAPITRTPPNRGIYPSIADLVALWLDTAAREGNLQAFLDRLRGQSEDAQAAEQTLMVNSLGIYQYRLPFADLLESIQVKYARSVLQILLVGPNSTDVPDMSPGRAREPFTQRGSSVRDLTLAFLSEELGGSRTLSQHSRRLLRALGAANADEIRTALREQRWTGIEEDTEAWTVWLQQTVELILNGRKSVSGDEKDRILTRRAAKVGLAYQFLNDLGHSQNGLLVKFARQQVAVYAEQENHPAEDYLIRFAEVAERLRDDLIEIAQGLGVEAKPGSVYAQLATADKEIERRISALAQPETRQYIAQDANKVPLVKTWFDSYLVETPEGETNKISAGVGQLSWRCDPGTGRLNLMLAMPRLNDEQAGREIVFDPQDTAPFIAGLLEIGSYFASQIRDTENLDTQLRATILQPDRLHAAADRLLDQSAVLLGRGGNFRATYKDQAVVLSASKGSADSTQQLREDMEKSGSLPRNTNLLSLETTDPFSLTLAQVAFAIPLEAIDSVRQAFERYQDEVRVRGQNTDIPLPAIFDADAVALGLESKLATVNSSQPLNPVVVSGLGSRIRAEAYLMMAVARSEWEVTPTGLVVSAEELGGPMTLLDDRSGVWNHYGVLMAGLLTFVQGVNDEQARSIIRRYTSDEQLVSALDQWDQNEGKDWKQRPYLPPSQDAHYKMISQIVENLIVVARLLIRERMGWDN